MIGLAGVMGKEISVGENGGGGWKWSLKSAEVMKLKAKGSGALNMKRTDEILEGTRMLLSSGMKHNLKKDHHQLHLLRLGSHLRITRQHHYCHMQTHRVNASILAKAATARWRSGWRRRMEEYHLTSETMDECAVENHESYISTFASTVKRNNPKVIPLLSIWTKNGRPGDYQNSSNFCKMAENFTFRKSFIESSIKKARFYGFEGLDLHVNTLLNTMGNMTNLGTLFDEWRVAIDSELKESTRDQKKLILTMAGYYVPELDSLIYPVDSIQRNFDWVSLSSYDYHTRYTDEFTHDFTAAHTALYDPSSRVNTDYGINEWVKRGLPANKMVMGLAYHGYTWTLVDHNDNGIGFDDVEAIRAKVAYAKEKGLLGYNVWQVPNDHNWELSKAAGK
uniref:Chitinase II n=1 Tax=Tanacetum cinerariifolium TaxID=118510 RepID=A0A6L2M3C1_TANCI|nr:chitinase II [Tanacetum cinerariifolium]